MKLSKTQKRILELMNSGWELGISVGYRNLFGSFWLQKGGLGKGGETIRNINFKTIDKLVNLELIKQCEKGFPTTHYKLVEKGKKLLENLK